MYGALYAQLTYIDARGVQFVSHERVSRIETQGIIFALSVTVLFVATLLKYGPNVGDKVSIIVAIYKKVVYVLCIFGSRVHGIRRSSYSFGKN